MQVQCPWESAISEIRVCFTLLSILAVIIGIMALKSENKKWADLHFQAGIFLSVLLAISAYFDYLAVQNSNTNNYNYCNLKDEFQVDKGITVRLLLRLRSRFMALIQERGSEPRYLTLLAFIEMLLGLRGLK